MLLDKYKEAGLLFNINFVEKTSEAGVFGYRGELVLIEGEAGDAKGHAKPPIEVMRGVVMLAADKMKMLIGALDQLQSITTLCEKYQADFAGDMQAVLFVVNLKSRCQVEINGTRFILIPLIQGVPWNEIIDELALEKSDFKGQSSADKIVTVYNELLNYEPKSPLIALDEALASTTAAVREAWGAV
jgi:hypothetical protein